MGDFILDTNTHCFLCSERTSHHQYLPVKQESDSKSCNSTPLLHSLHYLSRYLKLDIAKVFNEEENVPSTLLTKVKRARLKVELCEECAHLNGLISRLCRALEKIELEMTFCLSRIQLKLAKIQEACVNDLPFKLEGSSYTELDVLKEKQQIVDGLRDQMLQKCSRISTDTRPRIKVQRLTTKEIIAKTLQRKRVSEMRDGNEPGRTTASNPTTLKEEVPDQEPFADDDYDGMSVDHDGDDDGHREVEESETHQLRIVAATKNKATSQNKYSRQGGKFRCNTCSKLYSHIYNFNVHYKSEHDKVQYACGLCKKTFNHRNSFNRHHISEHRRIRFKCERCGNIYSQKNYLKAHIKKVHLKKR